MALGLLLPVLILFRYSFNRFKPRVMMVEAVTLENYVKFFTDPFYTNIFLTTLRVAVVCTADLPGAGVSLWPMCSRAPRAATRTCC